MKTLILISILLTYNAFGANKILASKVLFTATGKPAFIKANGSVVFSKSNLTLKNNVLNGDVLIDLTKLDSGIDMRDQHVKNKYLETQKHPIATLSFKNQKIMDSNVEVQAILKVKGAEKQVNLKGIKVISDKSIEVNTSFDFKLSDFGIELPSFQGITAANIVKIKVQAKVEL